MIDVIVTLRPELMNMGNFMLASDDPTVVRVIADEHTFRIVTIGYDSRTREPKHVVVDCEWDFVVARLLSPYV